MKTREKRGGRYRSSCRSPQPPLLDVSSSWPYTVGVSRVVLQDCSAEAHGHNLHQCRFSPAVAPIFFCAVPRPVLCHPWRSFSCEEETKLASLCTYAATLPNLALSIDPRTSIGTFMALREVCISITVIANRQRYGSQAGKLDGCIAPGRRSAMNCSPSAKE